MKALSYNALKKKKEAFELIKQALFKNLANFTCWHVYGILHRSNKYLFIKIFKYNLEIMMKQEKHISMH